MLELFINKSARCTKHAAVKMRSESSRTLLDSPFASNGTMGPSWILLQASTCTFSSPCQWRIGSGGDIHPFRLLEAFQHGPIQSRFNVSEQLLVVFICLGKNLVGQIHLLPPRLRYQYPNLPVVRESPSFVPNQGHSSRRGNHSL